MKNLFITILFTGFFHTPIAIAQNLDVEGKAKISVMDKVNTADSVVVVLADGVLAMRDVYTLTEYQILSISNDTVFLSEGGFVKLPPDLVDDADNDPTNELQNWSTLPGIPLAFLDGLDNTEDLDADPTNEIQTLNIQEDTISLTGGGSVTLPVDDVDDADNDPTNELDNTDDQTIDIAQLVGTNLELSLESDGEATKIIDLSSLQDGTGTDDQTLAEVLGQSNDAASTKIVNLSDPTAAQDAATKNYVDQMTEKMLDAGLNGIVMDIDDNVYQTIKIGTQVWMAENLKTTRYNDGTSIPHIADSVVWSGLTTPAYSWYDKDSTKHAKLFGALYNYYTVADTNGLNLCPSGWYVPTDGEWTVLTDFLEDMGYAYGGTGTDIGKSIAATFRWSYSSTSPEVGWDLGSNNSSGFTGLPGGIRVYHNGKFSGMGDYTFWWSSTEETSTNAWYRRLRAFSSEVLLGNHNKKYGFAVRCLRD